MSKVRRSRVVWVYVKVAALIAVLGLAGAASWPKH